jgi:DNA-binding CsgD family transcriptional regulator
VDEAWPDVRSGVFGPEDAGGRLTGVDLPGSNGGGRLHGLVGIDDGAPATDGPWLAVELRLGSGDDPAAERTRASLRVALSHLAPRYRLAFGDSATRTVGRVTPSEQVVLEQLVMGRSVKEIADELSRSPHTIHDHIKSLHRKFGASNRGQLVARALGHAHAAEG